MQTLPQVDSKYSHKNLKVERWLVLYNYHLAVISAILQIQKILTF